MITLEEARAKAEARMEYKLASLVVHRPLHWLREGHMEERNCWLFLKASNLQFRDKECEAWSGWAIVVSKKGATISIADHHENEAALRAYLAKMSEHLEQRGE